MRYCTTMLLSTRTAALTSTGCTLTQDCFCFVGRLRTFALLSDSSARRPMLTQAAMQGRARSGLICLACRHAHDLLQREVE